MKAAVGTKFTCYPGMSYLSVFFSVLRRKNLPEGSRLGLVVQYMDRLYRVARVVVSCLISVDLPRIYV
jgi:hypothetical protein